jgi:1,4-dihydroxy-2-naphthoyl-CoA hydrolase
VRLWNHSISLAELDAIGAGTTSENSGIHYTAIGDDWIEASMALDTRTRDPDGAMHPGALGILAETIGSVAASLCIDTSRQICVGQILHINHPIIVTAGPVRARATAIAILSQSHIWDVDIKNPSGAIVCAARLTMAILDRDDPRMAS